MAKKSPVKKAQRSDGWSNLVTSLGTSADKRMYGKVLWEQRSQEEYEQMYAGDEICSRIVNVIPEEAMSKGVEWVGVDKDLQPQLDARAHQLDLRGAVERTWKWGRAFGGACLYIVTDTNDPASPLKPGEKVIGLRDLSRYDLRILTTDVESDFGSPNWGHPNIYYLTVQMGSEFKGYPIHWTRMVRFDGQIVPRRTFIRNNYWHDSVLNRLHNAIRNYQTANDACASILQDFNVGIYKMKNLANLMSAGKESVIKARIEMLNFSKSVIRAMILDSDDEEFEDMSRSVEGLAELLTKQANRLVAATDMPHTKLLGESPDGSSATGNSTTQQWFDHLRSEQENYLRPRMKRLVKAIYPEYPDLDFKFKSLYQMTELEQADMRLKQAQTDQIYLSESVLDPSEVAESRFGDDEYSTETKLDKEARAAGMLPGNADPAQVDPLTGQPVPPAALPPGQKPPTPGAKPPAAPAAAASAQGGVEADKQTTPFKSRNEQIPGREKVKPFISQTMSEPMRDPKTDPKLKPGGKPNKPRQIERERGNGSIAQSGHKFGEDNSGKPTPKK